MSIRTNLLSSLTVQLLRHSWPPDALSIWPSSTLINSRGSACVLRDFYVDVMLTGTDTIDELKPIRDETIQLLKLGAFELSKWASNCPELLETNNRDRLPVIIRDNAADSCILGMQWNQCQDTLQFLCNLLQNLTYQNESYFPRSLDCSILWAFWVRSLWSQSSSCKTCGNWPSNGTSLFLRTSTLIWIAFRTDE